MQKKMQTINFYPWMDDASKVISFLGGKNFVKGRVLPLCVWCDASKLPKLPFVSYMFKQPYFKGKSDAHHQMTMKAKKATSSFCRLFVV